MSCCKDHGPFGDGWHAKEDVEEIDRLREALEGHWDHDETWCFACHRSLDECSARNALKEAT